MGVQARDLTHPNDRAAARWLMANLWKTGEAFTTIVRRVDNANQLFESHVLRLQGVDNPRAISIIRPFRGREARGPVDPEMAASASQYVVDMTRQMALMAAKAVMPVTSDLLMASAAAGEREAGLMEVNETPQ